jgi:hypothetical protein
MKPASATGVALAALIALTAAADAAPKPKPGDLTGIWTGLEAQAGRAKQFAVALNLNGKTGESSYADQHCTGKLTRIGTSGDYSFFTETSTEGKYDATAKTGCIDGAITLIKAGDAIVMGWAAAHEGKPIIAWATLAPQPTAAPAAPVAAKPEAAKAEPAAKTGGAEPAKP